MVNETVPPIEISPDQLSADALTGVIDNFVMREGTDYGRSEVSYETKIENLRRQIAAGQVKILFDPNTESVTLMATDEWKKRKAGLSID